MRGSAGLGRGVAEMLAANGVNVRLAACSEDRLRQTADEIGSSAPGRVTWVVAPVSLGEGGELARDNTPAGREPHRRVLLEGRLVPVTRDGPVERAASVGVEGEQRPP